MREGVAALLGRDLGLPIPEAFAVEITDQFVSTITDAEMAQIFQRSIGWNFGSLAQTPQFSRWIPGKVMPLDMRPVAAEVLAFDAMIQNPDRQVGNANCSVRGDKLIIYDHDLAFSFLDGVLFWRPPWQEGGLDFLVRPPAGRHVFLDDLRGIPHAF